MRIPSITSVKDRFLEERTANLVRVVIALTVLVDVLVIIFPRQGKLGNAVWLTGFLTLGFVAVQAWIANGKTTAEGRPRAYFTTTVTIVWMAVGLYFIGGFDRAVHHEALAEINAATLQLDATSSGFRERCHVGYPCRGYLLGAVITKLFGPSDASIRAGFLAWFVLGISMLGAAIARCVRDRDDDLRGAMALLFPAGIYFFRWRISYPEQMSLPFALATYCCGAALLFYRTGKPVYAAATALLLMHAVNAYTPAFSLVVLFAALLPIYFAKKERLRSTRQWMAAYALAVALAYGFSLGYRWDVLFRPLERSWGTLAQTVANGATFVAWPSSEFPFATLFSRVFMIATVFAGILGYAGKAGVVGAAWVLLVLLGGLVLPGYAIYGFRDVLHRAMVAVPAIVVLVFFLSRRAQLHGKILVGLLAATLVAAIYPTGAWNGQILDPARDLARWIERRAETSSVNAVRFTHSMLEGNEQQYFQNYFLYRHPGKIRPLLGDEPAPANMKILTVTAEPQDGRAPAAATEDVFPMKGRLYRIR